MNTFHCDTCGSLVFFENVRCLRCDNALGFLPDVIDLSTLEPAGEEWKALVPVAEGRLYRSCANNVQHQICNWYIPREEPGSFCRACSLNEVIPDLSVPANHELWRKLEIAKRRMVYTLLRLSLPTEGSVESGRPPLRFRFLSDSPGRQHIMTGHDGGLITINVAEANDAERERRRVTLHEPFRTLLGHMRHEVAHYYWGELVGGTDFLPRFRELFGDETRDYSESLQAYYQAGPPADWQSRCITAYATAHPWEDWAETSAHYFHITDTLETAASFGLRLKPRHPNEKAMTADPAKVARADTAFERLLQQWFPLTYALNELNRGVGLSDLYPFILSTPAIEKLRFVHEVLQSPATAAAGSKTR